MVDNECHTMSEDRISQLPDPLIHHIFSFIPTIYLVRMSFLSERWRHLWVSTPFLYFEDFSASTFHKKVRKRDRALKFVTDFVTRHELCMQIPNRFIISFKCDLFYSMASRRAVRRIDDWLSIVVNSKLKELDLHLKDYVLPQCILNASSLTVLKLTKLYLFVPYLSTLLSLKFLSLVYVKSDPKSVRNLISGCPIIEELYLSGSEIVLFDFPVSETLRSLSLTSMGLTNQCLDCLFSRLPQLERLFFSSCKLLNNIGICSHSLKYVFFEYLFPIKAALTTPNLVGLRIVCHSWSKISVEAPNLLEVNLTLMDEGTRKDSYIDRVHLLSNLNFWKMVLTIYKDEVLIFPKRIRQKYPSPMPNLKHLKVMSFSGRSFTKITEMRNSLLWCAPSLESLEIGRDGT